jgi:hypothetical protein
MTDWIEWGGGACPVPKDALVQVKLVDGRSSDEAGVPADALYWDRHSATFITAYRVVPKTTSKQAEGATASALDVQEGGAHYKGKTIQPVEYISANNLNFLEGCIVKRITRWRDKQTGGDRFVDLRKIKHEVDLLIEMEEKFRAKAAS